jgi:hypothetical protein
MSLPDFIEVDDKHLPQLERLQRFTTRHDANVNVMMTTDGEWMIIVAWARTLGRAKVYAKPHPNLSVSIRETLFRAGER